MALHHRTHPTLVRGCFACRVATVEIPTQAEVPQRGWDRDLAEYERAKKLGLQPAASTAKASREARKQAGDFEVTDGS